MPNKAGGPPPPPPTIASAAVQLTQQEQRQAAAAAAGGMGFGGTIGKSGVKGPKAPDTASKTLLGS